MTSTTHNEFPVSAPVTLNSMISPNTEIGPGSDAFRDRWPRRGVGVDGRLNPAA
jgi:hypothetical protein